MNCWRKYGNSTSGGKAINSEALEGFFTSRARPCLAVALLIVLALCFLSFVTTVQAIPADPGHGASAISAGTFESGDFTFPDNLTVNDFLKVDTNTLYVNALNNRVGIGTDSPSQKSEVSGNLLV